MNMKLKRLVTRATVFFCGLFALSSFAATVSDIKTTTHYPFNGNVDVSYTVADVSAGSSYVVTAQATVGEKTYDILNTTITANGTYDFHWDAASAGVLGRYEDVKITFTVEEPSYAVVDLSKGSLVTSYPVSYNATVEDPTADTYKTDKLLLKRVGDKFVGVFEVTQKQYENVMGYNPAYFSVASANVTADQNAKRPVERVSYDILTVKSGFFDRLSTRTGLTFALPTGDEWTAAAAGKMDTTAYQYNLGAKGYYAITGNDSDWLPLMGRYVDLWNGTTMTKNGNGAPNQGSAVTKGTAIVGSYAANDNGLYDMHGNVAEWTTDTTADGKYVLRGGKYNSTAAQCAIGDMTNSLLKNTETNTLYWAGFRVFGAAAEVAAANEQTAVSSAFTVDVAKDNTRSVTVVDNGNGSYTYKVYGKQWYDFDEGDTSWRPVVRGSNKVTYNSQNAYFVVDALTATENYHYTVKGYTGTYDEQAHTGAVTVKTAKMSDAEVTYDPEPTRTEAGTTTVTYTIESPFYETVTGTFDITINPKSLADAAINLGATPSYDGTVKSQALASVTVAGISYDLVADRDYTLSGNTGTAAKDYTLTITGKGNFKDTATAAWKIVPQDISAGGGSGSGSGAASAFTINCSDYDTNGLTYNGQEQELVIDSVSATIGGTAVAVTYEIVSGNKGTDAGTYTVTVKGTGNFQGEVTRDWEIKPLDLADATDVATLGTTFTYNGDAQKVVLADVTAVTANGLTVKTYTVACDEQTKAGTYQYTVTPTDSNFTGTKSFDWTIAQRALDADMFTIDPEANLTYDRTAKEPTYTASDKSPKGVEAIATTDWSVAYTDNTNAGENTAKATFTAAADGNYTGTVTKSFTIAKCALSSVTINAPSKTQVWTGSELKVNKDDVTVEADGITLTKDEFFMWSSKGNWKATGAGVYTVYVGAWPKNTDHPLGGNFSGEVTDTWTIVPAKPTLSWTDKDGAASTDVDTNVFFHVTDLSIAATGKSTAEKLAWSFETQSGEEPVVSGDKCHIVEQTKVTVTPYLEGTSVTGMPTVVNFIPGKCADLTVTPTNFMHNATVLTIAPATTNIEDQAGNMQTYYLVDGKALTAAPVYSPTGTCGTVYYTIVANGSNVVERQEYVPGELKVSADKLTILTWTEDDQYVDSNVTTQEVTRTLNTCAAPEITITPVAGDADTFTVTIADTNATPFVGAKIYYTYAIAQGPAEIADAKGPKGLLEEDYDSETCEYVESFTVTLKKDEVLDVKAVIYEPCTEHEGCFTGRSEVGDAMIVRDWAIGDAMDSEDQLFVNADTTSTNAIPNYDYTTYPDKGFVVCTNDADAVGGECMRSFPMTDGNMTVASMSTTVEGAGMLTFNWKMIGEDDPTGTTWDHGELWIDGAEVLRADAGDIAAWTGVTNMLASGTHTITWRYMKDWSKSGTGVAEGEDGLFIDNFAYTAAPEMSGVSITVDDFTYDQTMKTPIGTGVIHVKVTDPETGSDLELVEGTDYTAAFADGARDHSWVGTYTDEIVLTATTATPYLQSGSTTNATWKVLPLDIKDAVVTLTTNLVYNGTEQTQKVDSIKVGDIEITAKTVDYTISGNTGTDAGDYTLTVTPKRQTSAQKVYNLTNSAEAVTCGWKIDPKDGTGLIDTIADETYTGSAITPTLSYTDTYVTEADIASTNYTDNVNVGTATVTVTFTGNYTGSATKEFKIVKATISSLTLNTPTSFTYDGAQKSVTVASVTTDNGVTLAATEYTLSGDTGTAQGTYTAKVVSNSDNFGGEATATWTIGTKALADTMVSLDTDTFTYNGSVQQPTVTVSDGTALTTTDYDVSIPDSIDADTYTVTVTAKGNYSGTITKDYTIGKATISSLTLAKTTIGWDGNEHTIQMADATVKAETDTLDVPSTDFYLSEDGKKGTDAGEYTAVAKAKSASKNFTGSASATWKILPTAPIIVNDNDNDGKVVFTEEYVTVKVKQSVTDQEWTLQIDMGDGNGWVPYDETTQGKRDISKSTIVQAKAVSKDGNAESVPTVVAFYNGSAYAPTIAYADADLLENDVCEKAGKDDIIVQKGTTKAYTTFYHTNTVVVLTRFGTMTEEESAKAIADTTVNGHSPYTDGSIIYTTDDWATTNTYTEAFTISETTTIKAKVVGTDMEDSPVMETTLTRETVKLNAPTPTADTDFEHSLEITAKLDTDPLACTPFHAQGAVLGTVWYKSPTMSDWDYITEGTMLTVTAANEGTWSFQTRMDDHESSDIVTADYNYIAVVMPDATGALNAGFDDVIDPVDPYAITIRHLGTGRTFTMTLGDATGLNPVPTATNYVYWVDADGDGVMADTEKVGEGESIDLDALFATYGTSLTLNVTASAGAGDDIVPTTVSYTFTLEQYKMNAPTISGDTTFAGSSYDVTITAPTPDTTVCTEHNGQGAVYYTVEGSAETNSFDVTEGSVKVTVTDTATVTAWTWLVDHDYSDEVTFTTTRNRSTIAEAMGAPDQAFTPSEAEGHVSIDTTIYNDYGHEDEYLASVKFSGLDDNETATVTTEVYGNGTVTFDWKSICEKGGHEYNYDHGEFRVDNEIKARIDGTNGWETVSVYLEGADKSTTKHTLKWSYVKDGEERIADDCLWVDNFAFTGALTPIALTDEATGWVATTIATELAGTGVTVPTDAAGYKAFLNTMAANGMRYSDCYIAGLSVTNENAKFVVDFAKDASGKPLFSDYNQTISLTMSPVVEGRVYTILALETLKSKNWATLRTYTATKADAEAGSVTLSTPTAATGYQFFKGAVNLK